MIKKKTARKGCASILLIAAVGIGIYTIVTTKTPSPYYIPSNENSSYNTLTADGRPLLYFSGISNDSCFTNLSTTPDSIRQGHVINMSEKNLHRIIMKCRERIRQKTAELDSITDEIHYYLGVHNVHDEGYDMIVAHAENITGNYKMLKHTDSVLSRITGHTSLAIIRTVRNDSAITPKPSVFIEYRGGVWKDGRWLKTTRSGNGISIDCSGRTICGIWHADTMTIGRRTDSIGTYYGQFDRLLIPSGHGKYTSSDGTFYEGHWYRDTRHGFGFEVSTDRLRAGEWDTGKYRGERMHYTSERIYGIDISRYQHGKGKKYYPIHWNKLRITHLGNISKKRVSGNVDYPVSFVYIKSTEGISIRNKYYADDYRQARRHGLHCGAYHFYSVKSDAASQARYFIRNTFFRKGDFPPVLDVEPSNRQIMKMGGPAVLADAIRTWMRIVKQHTGVKPILYVNQTFVNKYLADAPDIKRDYNIWIARYGEYRPDVRLVYWQLCPDGKTNGIHGDVDINVFNGYQDKFDAFLETELIK